MVRDRPIVSNEVEQELVHHGQISVTTVLFVTPPASGRLADRPGEIGTPYARLRSRRVWRSLFIDSVFFLFACRAHVWEPFFSHTFLQ